MSSDVAEELSEHRGDGRRDQGQLHRIPQGTPEELVAEQALTVERCIGRFGQIVPDPREQRQVVRAVAHAGLHLERFHDQEEQRHEHRDNDEDRQKDQHPPLRFAERDQVRARSLAADRGVGLARADQPLIDEDRTCGKQDHHDGKDVSDRLGARAVQEPFHLGRQHVIACRFAETRRNAVGADRLRYRHDRRRQDRRQHQRQRNALQDLDLVRALDLAHFLKLGVDGPQRAGYHDIGERVIVHRHDDDDRDRPVGKPFRHRNPHAGQKPE